jgi:hypothetical protein
MVAAAPVRATTASSRSGARREGDDRARQTTTGSPTDAEAVVVQLDTAPPEFHRYQRVGKEILLMLDAGDRPLVGDAQHSFTLSQTQ